MKKIIVLLVIVLASCKKPQKKIIGEWFFDSGYDVTLFITEDYIEYNYTIDFDDITRRLDIKSITNSNIETISNGVTETITYFFKDGDLFLSNGMIYSRYSRVK